MQLEVTAEVGVDMEGEQEGGLSVSIFPAVLGIFLEDGPPPRVQEDIFPTKCHCRRSVWPRPGHHAPNAPRGQCAFAGSKACIRIVLMFEQS